MKNVLFLLAVLLTATVNGQNFKLASTGGTRGEATTKIVVVDGMEHSLYVSSSGAHYQERVSKNGNQYKSYLGYATQHLFEGQPVYSNKEGTQYWILGTTKTGYLKKIMLLTE